jgi:hypothetical protein
MREKGFMIEGEAVHRMEATRRALGDHPVATDITLQLLAAGAGTRQKPPGPRPHSLQTGVQITNERDNPLNPPIFV